MTTEVKMLKIKKVNNERGEHDVIRETLRWFWLHTILWYKTLCGAFSESQFVKNRRAEVDIGLPLLFVLFFYELTWDISLFRPQTMFCLWPFAVFIVNLFKQRAHKFICVALFFWKDDTTWKTKQYGFSVLYAGIKPV